MSLDEIFQALPQALKADAISDGHCLIQFMITEPRHIALNGTECKVLPGIHPQPDVTLTLDDADLADLLLGALDGVSAFMSGRLQVTGDLMLAQSLTTWFDSAELRERLQQGHTQQV